MDAGRRAEARARLDEAIELIESLRQRISRRQDRAVFFSRWLEPYRLSTLLYLAENDARPGAGFDDRAFRETERARGRALAESVAEAEVRLSGDLPEDLRSRETELSSRLRDLQKRLASSEEGERRGIEEEIFQSEAEWQRFLVDVRARSRRYASLHFPEAISAERARALCDSSTAIVSYALAEPLSHVFVLTRTSLAIVSLPTDLARVSEEVSSFVGLLSSPQGGEPEKLAARLEEDLVEPWRRSLPASVKRLVIVPDGDLHSMPFEVLPQPSRGGRRLLDDFAVSYVPSVTLLAQLSALPRPPPGVPVDVLAFAAPPSPPAIVSSGATFDGERVQLGPLPGTGDEARFAALSGGAASRVYIGPEASEQRVKEERMDRYGVLHFATHTLVSAQVPSRSALVLAGTRGDGAER